MRTVQPDHGHVSGGTVVRVVVTNVEFSAALQCRFGASQRASAHVPANFVSRTEVECVTPPYAAVGPVKVQLTRNGVDYEPSDATFTYTARTVQRPRSKFEGKQLKIVTCD